MRIKEIEQRLRLKEIEDRLREIEDKQFGEGKRTIDRGWRQVEADPEFNAARRPTYQFFRKLQDDLDTELERKRFEREKEPGKQKPSYEFFRRLSAATSNVGDTALDRWQKAHIQGTEDDPEDDAVQPSTSVRSKIREREKSII